MKHRGLDPLTRGIFWGAFAVVIGIALGATVPAAVRVLADAAATQHDALPWYATRLFAFLAYFSLAASVIYGLLLSTKILDAIAHRPVTFALHQDLASIGLGLAGVHAMLLTLDTTQPFTLLGVLVPFAAPYRPLWVGVGQVAIYITLVVVASFYLRRQIGQRAWRLIHYTTFLAFVGSTLHGLQTGSDSNTVWAWWSYAIPTTIVVFLFAYRVVTAISRSRRPMAAPRPVGPLAAALAERVAPGSIQLRTPQPSPLELRAPRRTADGVAGAIPGVMKSIETPTLGADASKPPGTRPAVSPGAGARIAPGAGRPDPGSIRLRIPPSPPLEAHAPTRIRETAPGQ